MSEQELLAAIKQLIREQMNTYGYAIEGRSDEEALDRFGSACSNTALILIAITGGYNQKTAKLYRFLDGMRGRGLLLKNGFSGGMCTWWPAGFADELRDAPDASAIAPYRAVRAQ